MVFALGGPAGVDEVLRSTFDVVITDMRMPEVDGASLLLQVRDHDPTTFRMILTGYADQASVTRALPVAHQFFDKPCSFKALRAMFVAPPMCALVERLAHIAAPEVTEARDPVVSARILRLAASIFLGTEPAPTGPQSAAAIALAAFVRTRLADPILGFSFDAHRLQSTDVAERTRAAVAPALAAHAFTAGLVHDLGRAIIGIGLPEAHAAIELAIQESGQPPSVVAHQVLGVTHAQLGAYMLSVLGTPFAVIDAVAALDDEGAEPSPLTVALRRAVAA
jgi:CheY-like chemotaxis protein